MTLAAARHGRERRRRKRAEERVKLKARFKGCPAAKGRSGAEIQALLWGRDPKYRLTKFRGFHPDMLKDMVDRGLAELIPPEEHNTGGAAYRLTEEGRGIGSELRAWLGGKR